MNATLARRLIGLIACAAAVLTGFAWPANADLPGQPNGIAESAHSYQWRFATGEICFEDWTNGFAEDAIKNAAAKYTASSDLAIYYRTDCEAAGFVDSNTITFVNNYQDCFEAGGKGFALIWTQGGYLVEGYTITRAVVHIHPNCPGTWGGTVPADQQMMRKRLVINHETGHVWGFLHTEYPICLVGVYQDWKCRGDTVMAGSATANPDGSVNYNPTAWDFYRIDQIHPW